MRRKGNVWRLRHVLRIGCMPASLIVVLGLIGVVLLFSFARVPSYVNDPLTYRVEGMLVVSGLMLFGFSVMGTWLLGILSARAGAHAVRGQGAWFRLRMRVVRRHLVFHTLTVVILRTLLIAVAVSGFLLALAWVIGNVGVDLETYYEYPLDLVQGYLPLALTVAGLLLLHLLIGPFLRMRLSTSLGAFGATFAPDRSGMISAAVTARAAAGLLGIVLIIWGVSLSGAGLLVWAAPVYSEATTAYNLRSWPLARDSFIRFVQFVIMALVALPLHMLVQVSLSVLLDRLTRTRLKNRDVEPIPRPWLETVTEG